MHESRTVTVGLDVHANSIRLAAIRGDELLEERTLRYDHTAVERVLRRWPQVRCCYEAGPHRLRSLPPPQRARDRLRGGGARPGADPAGRSRQDRPAVTPPARPRRRGAGRKEIDEVLEMVKLLDRAGDRVSEYSQGMRQRLGIASCLIRRPRLLILDEPANGVDPAGIRFLRGLLRRLAEQGITILLSSHLLAEVQQVGLKLSKQLVATPASHTS